MNLWVLDTDHVSLFQQNHPLVVQRVAMKNPEELGVTIITAEEQLRGRFNTIRRASSSSDLVLAYSKLQLTLDYYSTINLLNFNQRAENIYSNLRHQKIRVGTQDLRIAAIVLSQGGILVTRNQRDFVQIPNLILEDWTVP